MTTGGCTVDTIMWDTLANKTAVVRAERAALEKQVAGTHYKDMPIQPWEVIDNYPFEQAIGYYRGTVEAYLMRAGRKGSELEDYEKALHTLEKLVAFYKSHRDQD